MNEICLHCHLLYFSSIILSFGHCESATQFIKYAPKSWTESSVFQIKMVLSCTDWKEKRKWIFTTLRSPVPKINRTKMGIRQLALINFGKEITSLENTPWTSNLLFFAVSQGRFGVLLNVYAHEKVIKSRF